MKKKLLLILPISLSLCGCTFKFWNPFKKQTTEETTQKEVHVDGDPVVIDDIIPDDPTQHATSMSTTPNAPFYLKVGETRKISVSLSPAPTLASEKVVSWNLVGDYLDYVVDQDNTYKVEVTGKAPGVAKLTATNTYNDTLTKTFTINVIDFDEENDYLWQYQSSDRAQFGYDNTEAKMGTLEGDAVLNGVTWHYTRSNLASLQSSMGAIGFGKGSNPETHIHLETTVDRLVEKFTIEAASANSLAKMTIKVGGTLYMNEKVVPKDDYDVIGSITSDAVLPDYGKIEIDVVTPEYDASQSDNPSYRKPGAFYLKSILINYKPEYIERIEIAADSQHQVDYFDSETITLAGLKLNKVSSRGVNIPVDIDKEETEGHLRTLPLSAGVAQHEAKQVELQLDVEGYENPFTTTYDIHVRGNDWVPTALAVEGSVSEQFLTEGDEVDYSGLSVKVIYDAGTNDFSVVKFEESNTLTFGYGTEGDPFVAEKVMEDGYTITVSGHFTSKDESQNSSPTTNFTVNANVLNITEAIYDRIDYRRSATYSAVPGLNSTGKAISYTAGHDNRVKLDYEKLASGNRVSDGKQIPKSNGKINISILDTNLSIDKFNIEFAAVNKNKNVYSLYSSIYGGDIYSEKLAEAENQKIIYDNFESHTNALYLAPSSTNYVGIVSILIRYKEVAHIQYDVACSGTPTKMDYNEGDKFDPTGLTVSLTPIGSEESQDITSYVKWYDGSSYSSAPQETLLPASTYVVGVFRDKTFNVNIGTVSPLSVAVTRVTSLDQIIEGGKYYITYPTAHLVLKGSTSNSDIRTAKGAVQDDSITGGDTMNVNITLNNDYMDIVPVEGGKYTISSRNGGYMGITKGGSATCSASVPNREFEFTINSNGTFTMMITCMSYDSNDNEKGQVTMYFGSNGSSLFNLYTTDKQNIILYKVN